MSQQVFVKPPAPTKTLLVAQIVISALFLPFGAGFVFIAEGEARPFVALFSVIWVVACLAIMIHAIKLLKLVKKGKFEIAEVGDANQAPADGFADRLRDLEALKKERLITEQEYQNKRGQILEEKW